jgi:hypothetical protein
MHSLFCSKTVDDIVFEVDCKMVVVEEGQVDIGKSIGVSGLGTCVELMLLRQSLKTGGNPSAEEQEEALENGAVQVNNVVHSFRLQSTQFDKKVSFACFFTLSAQNSCR